MDSQQPTTNVAPFDAPRRRGRPRTGRKDASGQEQVTKPEVIQNRMPELERLYEELRTAREDFNAAVKSAAEDGGYNAGAVRAHVVAVRNDRVEQARTKANQQLELFEFALFGTGASPAA